MTLNVRFVQGDAKVLRLTVKKNGVVLPLSGLLSAKYRAARDYGSAPVIEKVMGAGISVFDANGGVVDITYMPGDTQSIQGEYRHELELIDSDGPNTAFQGYLTLDPSLIA